MRLTIPKPFDGHAHLRDGAMLQAVLPYTVRQFAHAIVMPGFNGEVDHLANGFDPSQILTDFDYVMPLVNQPLRDSPTCVDIQ